MDNAPPPPRLNFKGRPTMPLGSPTHPGQALQGTQIPPPREVLACPGPGRHGPDNPPGQIQPHPPGNGRGQTKEEKDQCPSLPRQFTTRPLCLSFAPHSPDRAKVAKMVGTTRTMLGNCPPFIPPGPFWAACVPQRCELHIFMVEPGRAACPPSMSSTPRRPT